MDCADPHCEILALLNRTERDRDMKNESNMTHTDVKPPPPFIQTRTQTHTQVVFADTQ